MNLPSGEHANQLLMLLFTRNSEPIIDHQLNSMASLWFSFRGMVALTRDVECTASKTSKSIFFTLLKFITCAPCVLYQT